MPGTYKLRYGILESHLIFNECGPYSGGPAGWAKAQIKKREKVALQLIKCLNDDRNFYNNLEESILKYGFRNPILINAGWCPVTRDRGINDRLPLGMQNNHSKILTCCTNGGSRLWVAQKYRLKIPCIIVDYIDRFSEFAELKDNMDLRRCYTDPPSKFIRMKDQFRIKFLPQVKV